MRVPILIQTVAVAAGAGAGAHVQFRSLSWHRVQQVKQPLIHPRHVGMPMPHSLSLFFKKVRCAQEAINILGCFIAVVVVVVAVAVAAVAVVVVVDPDPARHVVLLQS